MTVATHGAQLRPPINPRWVQTVLRERGVPVPTVKQLETALGQLDGAGTDLLRERIQRLHKASEKPNEMAILADWVSTIKTAPPVQSPAQAPVPVTAAPVERGVQDTSSPNPARPKRTETEPRRDPSHHVYGSKAAATFEPTVIEAGDPARELPFHTLMIEMAPADTKSRYDWEKKIIFRLTRRELPLVVAWLFGWCQNLEFGGHGQSNDKALFLEDQQSHLFMKLKQGRRLWGVQIGGEEIPALAAMALKAMDLNSPWMDSQTQLQVAKRAGSMYALSVASRSS